jgi:hypothetical protein
MMKRLFDILIITLAVVVLLVSASIPHHHHGNMTYIDMGVCHCEHDCGDDRHHHDDRLPFDDDDCVSKASYVVSPQSEIKCKFCSHDDNNHNIHFVPILLGLVTLYDTEAKLVYLTKHRYKEQYLFPESADVNRINGLRAPPYSVA